MLRFLSVLLISVCTLLTFHATAGLAQSEQDSGFAVGIILATADYQEVDSDNDGLNGYQASAPDSDSCGFVWGGATDDPSPFKPEEDPEYEFRTAEDSGWSTTYPAGSFSSFMLWLRDFRDPGLSQPDEPFGN